MDAAAPRRRDAVGDRMARMKPQKKLHRMAHDHTTYRRFMSHGSGRPFEADYLQR